MDSSNHILLCSLFIWLIKCSSDDLHKCLCAVAPEATGKCLFNRVLRTAATKHIIKPLYYSSLSGESTCGFSLLNACNIQRASSRYHFTVNSHHPKCWWRTEDRFCNDHYSDVIMGTIAYQITSLPIVYSTVYSDADQRKYQSSASLAFVRGIHRSPVNSPHKRPVTRKMFPFADVIII